jgi:hypothetical protein
VHVHRHAGTRPGDPTSGLVAYLDGVPVGWCAVEPRTEYPRLVTTRNAIEEELHVGTVRTFADAGMSEVGRPTKRRAVMRIDF